MSKQSIKVTSNKNFLFLTFNCPYCEKQNVLNKSYISVEVVCSNLGCRRVLILDTSYLKEKNSDNQGAKEESITGDLSSNDNSLVA